MECADHAFRTPYLVKRHRSEKSFWLASHLYDGSRSHRHTIEFDKVNDRAHISPYNEGVKSLTTE